MRHYVKIKHHSTAEEIVNTAQRFRETEFPIDAIVLDWLSWKGDLWGQKTFDEERFPAPAGMILQRISPGRAGIVLATGRKRVVPAWR